MASQASKTSGDRAIATNRRARHEYEILETMYRGLGFQRVVFCLRDPKTDTMVGRFGLGHQVEAVAKVFRVDLKRSVAPDLFAAVCLKNVDTLITDALAPHIAQRLPA